MSSLTPREIVSELDKFVVGQAEAKRMPLRNFGSSMVAKST